MELLELPFDLIWEGKVEPLSPHQLALANSQDILIFDNDFPQDYLLNELDQKKSAEELFIELQKEIIDENTQDSVDSNQWLDEPITLPFLAEFIQPQQTAQLLREFNSVLDSIELNDLTPPQTPPDSPQVEHLSDLKLDQFIYTPTSQPLQPVIVNPDYFNFDPSESIQSLPCSQDIDHEMEEVEELVRSRSENLPDCTSDDDSSESYSPNSSPRSDESFGNASPTYSTDDVCSLKAVSPSKKQRKRPYGQSSEDKKVRKKEQNKSAATRYRQKKKAEVEVVLEEERELQEKNDQLQVKYKDIKREIKYLKGLMRDLYRLKGIL